MCSLNEDHLQAKAVRLTSPSSPSTAAHQEAPPAPSYFPLPNSRRADSLRPATCARLSHKGIWAEKWQAFGGKNRAGSVRCPCSALVVMPRGEVRKIQTDGNATSLSASTKVEETSQNEQRDMKPTPAQSCIASLAWNKC